MILGADALGRVRRSSRCKIQGERKWRDIEEAEWADDIPAFGGDMAVAHPAVIEGRTAGGMIAAWRVTGDFGLDHWVLPLVGLPWSADSSRRNVPD
ncbi:MAG: hypothetical protein ABIS84_14535 [Arachnia sp.]